MANLRFAILLGWSLVCANLAIAQPLPVHSPVPGGIAVVDLGEANSPRPKVTLASRQVLVIENEGHWTALVGIPLAFGPGRHEVKVHRADYLETISLQVDSKEYPAQSIRLPKGKERYVVPPPEALNRIVRERKQLEKILATWSERAQVDTDFHWPVQGRIGSPFGLHRFFNGEPRSPHLGLDLVAPQGTPVKVPAAGTVLATEEFFFTGKAVFLDHGQGLISGYFHLERIDVQPGQAVQRGEVLGVVGATGRVTGPHLHFSVYLNRTAVDPELFLRRHLANAQR